MTQSKGDPHVEGREAFMEGIPLHSCPYPEDSEESAEWGGGWIAAEEEDAQE
ncbi:Rmf/CrpP family protein [Thioalkalivibrio sp. ALgr3]|uniref:Rmf/CrpP family protein n=1 Tax=Thioalkalivibrio sp. ALgr3 TaxID=1239292 RepID=UPI00039E9D9F|nr:Rmf/CrpP family protein [Thioalkalivibrio sp. ALgr3]